MASEGIHLLCLYVPADHAAAVKAALFAAGAGRIGAYDCCSWQTEGQGQYRPLEGSHPFRGQTDRVESVAEVRLEVLVPAACLQAAEAAATAAHPYETPVILHWPVGLGPACDA